MPQQLLSIRLVRNKRTRGPFLEHKNKQASTRLVGHERKEK